MIDVSTPPNIAANHFMCSQSGNIQDLGACSGSPSCIIGSNAEPDSSSRHDYIQNPSQPSDMGLRYMTLNSQEDIRFDTGSSNSPVCSLEPSVSSYSSSSYNISPYTPLYHHNLGSTTYANSSSAYYPPNTYLTFNEKQSRSGSFNTSSGLAHISRPSPLPHPTTQLNTRDIYTGTTPIHLRRASDLISRSPSLPSSIRGAPLSPVSTGGYTSTTTMDSTPGGACPPLNPTDVIYELRGQDGAVYQPDIYAKIDKGFFLADKDWTCYRRNYFSLNCSYTIHPQIPTGPLQLYSPRSTSGETINGFAMSIAAVVDGQEGKAIELVQHTPKRDKGPQQKPERVTLQPRPPQQHSSWGDNSLGGSSRGLYESQAFNAPPGQSTTEANFERIQFKNATANNGKRRAAQQYYHIIVELYADLGPHHHGDRWIKIATRMSAPMVVRGRSPGHYQSERRGSNASSGPGSGGASGGGSYTPSNISRTPGELNLGGSSSVLSHSAFGSNFDGRSHNYRSNVPSLSVPLEATMPTEVQKTFYETPGYTYQYGPIYDGQENRYSRSGPSDFNSSRVKHEYGSGAHPTLPSLSSTSPWSDRWGSSLKSEPYFPQFSTQEVNI